MVESKVLEEYLETIRTGTVMLRCPYCNRVHYSAEPCNPHAAEALIGSIPNAVEGVTALIRLSPEARANRELRERG